MSEPESDPQEIPRRRKKRGRPPTFIESEEEAQIKMEQAEDENPRRRKLGKLIRPKCFKIADEDTLEQIVYPPPKPEPEFSSEDYISGVKTEVKVLYMCNEPNCNAKFTTANGLALHRNKHLNRKYRCTFCNMLFKTNQDMDIHLQEFHPDLTKDPDANPLKCKKCNKISKDQKALWRHVRESHRSQSYPCPHCDFPFTRPENLKEHLKTKHPSKDQPKSLPTFPCKICGKKFAHRNAFRTHIREKHRGKLEIFRCVICNTIYKCKPSYRHHMQRHVDPTYVNCDICNLKFRNGNHLRRHRSSYRHRKREREVKLKKIDVTPVPVIKTVKTANTDLSKEELVKLCKQTIVKIVLPRVDEHVMEQSIAKIEKRDPDFLKPEEEDEEEESNEDEANQKFYLICLYCDQEFASLEAVKSHELACYMKITNKKVLLCPICNKEFDKPYKLKIHSRKHTDERPFPCSYCDSVFKSNTIKINHEKAVHFGIRPDYFKGRVYKCDRDGCSRQYKRPEGLRRHVQAHHLKVRYNCEKCHRSYQRLRNLKDHMKIDHSETPVIRLECKPCNRTYKNRTIYLGHLEKRRHGRKVEEYEERQFRKMKKKTKKKPKLESSDDQLEKSSAEKAP